MDQADGEFEMLKAQRNLESRSARNTMKLMLSNTCPGILSLLLIDSCSWPIGLAKCYTNVLEEDAVAIRIKSITAINCQHSSISWPTKFI